MKYLPRDISTFSRMITENYLYVDKTQYIYNLYSTRDRYHFLARPRRFGKSLLLSTLMELFSGNRNLFKGLWIDQSDFAFTQHPVLYFDFMTMAYSTPDELKASIHYRLNKIATNYDIDLSSALTLEDKTTLLIENLAKINTVVLLVDEYDQPLVSHINNSALATANQAILKSFYGTIKGLDAYFRAIFVTGVSKFSRTSIFSGLNNLHDISENPNFAALLGYTAEEINHYFKEHINAFSQAKKISAGEIMEEMRYWYNGYRFSRADQKVYNPFSVLYYLKDQLKANYWFESGTPTYLIEILKRNPLVLSNLENPTVSSTNFGSFDVENVPPLTILYQTGYLTIKDYQELFDTEMYTLGFPNEEVKRSVSILMIGILTSLEKAEIDSALFRLRMSLFRNDIDTFCKILQSLFAQIPYQLHIQLEAYYHSLIHNMANLLGFAPQSEGQTDKGRIDFELVTTDRVYIIEFKINKSRKKALDQIIAKRYYEKYLASNKKVTLVGINFHMKDKTLSIDCTKDELLQSNLSKLWNDDAI